MRRPMELTILFFIRLHPMAPMLGNVPMTKSTPLQRLFLILLLFFFFFFYVQVPIFSSVLFNLVIFYSECVCVCVLKAEAFVRRTKLVLERPETKTKTSDDWLLTECELCLIALHIVLFLFCSCMESMRSLSFDCHQRQ